MLAVYRVCVYISQMTSELLRSYSLTYAQRCQYEQGQEGHNNHGTTVTMTILLKNAFNIISDTPALLAFNCLIPNFTSSIENGWLILSFVDVFNKRGTDSSK